MKVVSIKVIQELLGHTTIEMTMRYAHLTPEVKHDAVVLLDGSATGQKAAWQPRGSGLETTS